MITIFKDVLDIKNPRYIEIADALERIKTGESKDKVEAIRAEQDKEKRSVLKAQLLCVIFTGEFSERNDKSLIKSSGYVVLDFDHVDDVEKVKMHVFNEPFVFAAWRSPSGDGVKALARIKFPEKHTAQYLSLEKHFKDKGISSDSSNKNLSRVCYESWDEEIFIKAHDVLYYEGVYEPPVYKSPIKSTQQVQVTDDSEIYNKLKLWMANTAQMFVEGNRNNFIARLAGACNRYGIDENSTISLLSGDYLSGGTFTQVELERTVKSIYRIYQAQYASVPFTKGGAVQTIKSAEEVFDVDVKIKDLIRFSDVYDNLEARIRSGVSMGETTYFKKLDECFRWMRTEVTVLHGFGNHGKSNYLNQLMMNKAVFNKYKWAVFSPENNPADYYYQDLSELYIGKPLVRYGNLPCASDEERDAAKRFVNEHFYYLYPKDDSPTPDYMLKVFMETIIKHKIDGCVIDPFNQLIHNNRGAREDLYLETILNQMKRFAQNHNIFLVIVAHPSKPPKSGTKQLYLPPDIFDISGGALWSTKADNVLCFHRPNFYVDPKDKWCTFTSQKIKKEPRNGTKGTVNYQFNVYSRRYIELEGEPTGENEHGYNPLDGLKPTEVQYPVQEVQEEDENEMPF